MSNPLHTHYPWTSSPLIAGAPMRLIALSHLTHQISTSRGIGFLGAGSDASTLSDLLTETSSLISSDPYLSKYTSDGLPIGVGFLLWAGDKLLQESLPLLEKYRPAAIWLFAPNESSQLVQWTKETRRVTGGRTKIWIQIGTVKDAVQVVEECQPEVLVVQGGDAGGHGLQHCAGLMPLVPEVDDAVRRVCEEKGLQRPSLVAAGGIMDSRGAAAALALGAEGVVLGTRYLAAPEANIAKGYRDAVLAASDGGVNTARGKLYDTLRGTRDWPQRYGGRAVLNETWYDAEKGMSIEENQRLYDEAAKQGDAGWGEKARLTTYAGSGVGLVNKPMSAADITVEVREGVQTILKEANNRIFS